MSRLITSLVLVAVCSAPAWGQTHPVRDLQRALNQDRQQVGLSPIAVDGAIGPETRGAIRALQRAVGLPPTGEADAATRTVLAKGRRAAVEGLQRALNRYRAARGAPALAVDGAFGPRSRAAVEDLQRREGLPATGVVDGPTRSALRRALVTPFAPQPSGGGGLVSALSGSVGGPRLARGSTRKVGLLQARLNDARRIAGLGPIGVDGSFGPQTQRAVEELQRRAGLPTTGVVDDATWDALIAAGGSPLARLNPAGWPTSGARYRRGNSGDADVEIHRQPNGSALVFESKFAVDADGAGNAWQSDPWGQPTTSLTYPNGTSLDPTQLHYFVLPIGFDAAHSGMRLGDLAAVIYQGRVAYAIYGDRGPRTKIGEGSIRLARTLGIPASPTTGGVGGGVTWVVFPGSGTGRPQTQAAIDARGAELLRALGGTP